MMFYLKVLPLSKAQIMGCNNLNSRLSLKTLVQIHIYKFLTKKIVRQDPSVDSTFGRLF